MNSSGQIAYEAYGDNRDWKTVSGAPMPRWDEQKPEISAAWEAAAAAAIADVLDRVKHDQEHAESGRMMARSLHDSDSVKYFDGKINGLGRILCEFTEALDTEPAPPDLPSTGVCERSAQALRGHDGTWLSAEQARVVIAAAIGTTP